MVFNAQKVKQKSASKAKSTKKKFYTRIKESPVCTLPETHNHKISFKI